MEERTHLQYWERKPPTLSDALIVLGKALGILSDALPIALKHVGAYPTDRQHDFWESFIDFSRETDLITYADFSEDDPDNEKSIWYVINDWREVAQSRVSHRTGSLCEDSDEAETQGPSPDSWHGRLMSSDAHSSLLVRARAAIMNWFSDHGEEWARCVDLPSERACKIPTSDLKKQPNCGKKTIALIRKLFPYSA